MAATLTRTTSGLLLREGFDAANGWTAETGWSRLAAPTLVTWGKVSTTPILEPGTNPSFDRDGVREPVGILADGQAYISYDAGNGTTGWRPCIAVSTDRFLGINDRYAGVAGLDNGASGSWAAVASGWLSKWGSTWVAHRITCSNTADAPIAGLPESGMGWDIWTASAIDGTWTYVRTVPLGTGGSWCDAQLLPCSFVTEGVGVYYHFPEGARAGEQFKIGLATSTSPSGVVTIGSPILDGSHFYGHHPENARCFYCNYLGRWIISVNLIEPSGASTTRNGIAVCALVNDWTTMQTYTTQSHRALCDGEDVIGIATPLMGSDGVTFEEDGYIPGLFDTDPIDGNHIGRKCYGLIWESSSHCLFFSDATTTRYRYYKSFAHTSFVAEFAVCFPAGPVAGSDVSFEFRSNGTNGYRAVIGNGGSEVAQLEKMDGTVLAAGTGTTIDAGVSNRIKIVAIDGAIVIYVNGQAQCSVGGETTYASGTQIAFSAKKCEAQIRLLSIYANTDITFHALSANSTTLLRSHGGEAALPVMSVIADNSGIALPAAFHYPLSRLEWTPGEVVQADDRLFWGGDVFEFSSGITPPAGGAGGHPVFGSD